jgi:hypothetical protein
MANSIGSATAAVRISGPLDVHHHGHVPLHLPGYFAHALHQRRNPLAGGVRHVQAQHVHARQNKLAEALRRFSRGADGGNDFGMAIMTAHRYPSFDLDKRGWFRKPAPEKGAGEA